MQSFKEYFYQVFLENRVNSITLNELISQLEEPPEDWVMDNFDAKDMDVPLPIKMVDPETLVLHDRPLKDWIEDISDDERASNIINYYKRQKDITPVILAKNRILDGSHRSMAFLLTHKPLPSVDMFDLP
jgi:hypothetical protein